MTKYGALALLLSIGLILTACGAGKGSLSTPEGASVEAVTESGTPKSDNETVEDASADGQSEASEDTLEDSKEPAGEVPTDISEEPQEPEGDVPVDTSTDDRITEEQALEVIRAHCYAQNPDLEGIVEAGEYPVYWEAVSEDDSQIIILYRTYTGVLVRYYIDPVTGDTYVTEYVPGITDEEEQTGETFNLRDEMAE